MAIIHDLPPEITAKIFNIVAEAAVSEAILKPAIRRAKSARPAALAQLCCTNKAFCGVAQPLLFRDLELQIASDNDATAKAEQMRGSLRNLAALAEQNNTETSLLARTANLSITSLYRPRDRHAADSCFVVPVLNVEGLRDPFRKLLGAMRPNKLHIELDNALCDIAFTNGLFDAITSLTVSNDQCPATLSPIFGPHFRPILGRFMKLVTQLQCSNKVIAESLEIAGENRIAFTCLQHLELHCYQSKMIPLYRQILETSELPRLRKLCFDCNFSGNAASDLMSIKSILSKIGSQLTNLGLPAFALQNLPELGQCCPILASFALINPCTPSFNPSRATLYRAPSHLRHLTILQAGGDARHFIYELRDRSLLPLLESLDLVAILEDMPGLSRSNTGTMAAVSGLVKRRGLVVTYSNELNW